MKTILTTEQNQHLVDLGLDKLSIIRERNLVTAYTRFNLTDLLEILPPKIPKGGNNKRYYKLVIRFHSDIHKSRWSASYLDEYDPDDYCLPGTIKFETEFIDLLYELVCWYYGEFKGKYTEEEQIKEQNDKWDNLTDEQKQKVCKIYYECFNSYVQFKKIITDFGEQNIINYPYNENSTN